MRRKKEKYSKEILLCLVLGIPIFVIINFGYILFIIAMLLLIIAIAVILLKRH